MFFFFNKMNCYLRFRVSWVEINEIVRGGFECLKRIKMSKLIYLLITREHNFSTHYKKVLWTLWGTCKQRRTEDFNSVENLFKFDLSRNVVSRPCFPYLCIVDAGYPDIILNVTTKKSLWWILRTGGGGSGLVNHSCIPPGIGSVDAVISRGVGPCNNGTKIIPRKQNHR